MVPSPAMRGKPPAGDRRLLQILDDTWAEAARRAGDRLVCKPGCTACCHGPFPINGLDAERLRRGLAELQGRDPREAEAVRARAKAQIPTLTPGFPGDAAAGALADDEADAWFSRHADLACPALDPQSGHCALYTHRPLSCRTFGPPVRIGGTDLPPCDLCFQGAPPEEVEACRVEPDPEGLEDRLVRRLQAAGETLIAWVLARA